MIDTNYLKTLPKIKASLEDDEDEYDNKFGNPKKSNDVSSDPTLK